MLGIVSDTKNLCKQISCVVSYIKEYKHKGRALRMAFADEESIDGSGREGACLGVVAWRIPPPHRAAQNQLRAFVSNSTEQRRTQLKAKGQFINQLTLNIQS